MCVTTGRSHDPQAAAARLAQRHAGPATHVVYSHPCGCALTRETVAVTPGRMPHEGWREGSSGADRLASRNVDDRHIWERIGHLVTVLSSIWLANCPRKGPAQAVATLIQGVVAAAAEPMYICFRDVNGATCVGTGPCRSACRSRNRAWHGHTEVICDEMGATQDPKRQRLVLFLRCEAASGLISRPGTENESRKLCCRCTPAFLRGRAAWAQAAAHTRPSNHSSTSTDTQHSQMEGHVYSPIEPLMNSGDRSLMPPHAQHRLRSEVRCKPPDNTTIDSRYTYSQLQAKMGTVVTAE